jgi:hypothetical protein
MGIPWTEIDTVSQPEIPEGWKYYGDHPPKVGIFRGWSHSHQDWLSNTICMTEPCCYIVPQNKGEHHTT